MLGKQFFLLNLTTTLLWSSVSWCEDKIPCFTKKERLEWSSGLKDELEKTTNTFVSLCANEGEWKWTQRHQDQLVVRVQGSVKIDSAIKSYAKDEASQDRGFRDLEIQIYDLPPNSSKIAYSGYCQFNPKEKSAPCFFVQPDQCKVVRSFETNHTRESNDLSANNLSKWVREGKKEKISTTIKKISDDFKNFPEVFFREDQNLQNYQDIVNSISPRIPLPRRHQDSLFGSLSKTKSLNQNLKSFRTKESWDIETYKQWSDLFGQAARACTKIPIYSEKANAVPRPSPSNGVK